MHKNILVTGASGFLGRVITGALRTDYNVFTLARNEADHKADLAAGVPQFGRYYDIVIHAAGKAHMVPTTEEQRKAFYDVNVEGTKNLLAALDAAPPKAFVFISTVAVYGLNAGENIHEDTPLLASDAYGKSKVIAEKILAGWCAAKGVRLSILRLPLVVGPGAPGNLKAMIDGIQKGYYFNIGKGEARKSMVLAKDIAAILPNVFNRGGIYNLTDGVHPSFKEISSRIGTALSKPVRSLPAMLARIIAFAGDFLGSKAPLNSGKYRKIVSPLTFDDSKARKEIGWQPGPVLEGLGDL